MLKMILSALLGFGLAGCSADAAGADDASESTTAAQTGELRPDAWCDGAPILRALVPNPNYPVASDWNGHDLPTNFWSKQDDGQGTFLARVPLAEANGEATAYLMVAIVVRSDGEVVATMTVRNVGADADIVVASTWGTQRQAVESGLNLEVVVPAATIARVGQLRCGIKLAGQ